MEAEFLAEVTLHRSFTVLFEDVRFEFRNRPSGQVVGTLKLQLGHQVKSQTATKYFSQKVIKRSLGS